MSESTSQDTAWYALPVDAVAQKLDVDPTRGLSAADAQQRLQQHGPNQLAAKKKESGWQAFLRQYRDFMQIVLVAAAMLITDRFVKISRVV